jgi:hypothetical protein
MIVVTDNVAVVVPKRENCLWLALPSLNHELAFTVVWSAEGRVNEVVVIPALANNEIRRATLWELGGGTESSTEEAGRGEAVTRRTRLKDKRLKIKFIEFFILVARGMVAVVEKGLWDVVWMDLMVYYC